jgi:hypothetical protein
MLKVWKRLIGHEIHIFLPDKNFKKSRGIKNYKSLFPINMKEIIQDIN